MRAVPRPPDDGRRDRLLLPARTYRMGENGMTDFEEIYAGLEPCATDDDVREARGALLRYEENIAAHIEELAAALLALTGYTPAEAIAAYRAWQRASEAPTEDWIRQTRSREPSSPPGAQNPAASSLPGGPTSR